MFKKFFSVLAAATVFTVAHLAAIPVFGQGGDPNNEDNPTDSFFFTSGPEPDGWFVVLKSPPLSRQIERKISAEASGLSHEQETQVDALRDMLEISRTSTKITITISPLICLEKSFQCGRGNTAIVKKTVEGDDLTVEQDEFLNELIKDLRKNTEEGTIVIEMFFQSVETEREIAEMLTLEQEIVVSRISQMGKAKYGESFEAVPRDAFQLSLNAVFLDLPDGLIEDVKALPEVMEVQPNRGVQFMTTHSVPTIGATSLHNLIPPITGNGVRVGIVDGGVKYSHQNITTARMWANDNEVPENGIDDDGNGIIDDYYGFRLIECEGIPPETPQEGTNCDRLNHGTHMADIVRAVAPGVQLIDLAVSGLQPKVSSAFYSGGHYTGSSREVVKAIEWAMGATKCPTECPPDITNCCMLNCTEWGPRRADVLNMSLLVYNDAMKASECYKDVLTLSVNNAFEVGKIVIVAAGGNTGNTYTKNWGYFAVYPPACAEGSIAVGSYDDGDTYDDSSDTFDLEDDSFSFGGSCSSAIGSPHRVASHSTKGYAFTDFSTGAVLMKPELVAPAICILSADIRECGCGCTDGMSGENKGTSYGAAHVSGAAALLLEKHPLWKYNPEYVKAALLNGARNFLDDGKTVYPQGGLNTITKGAGAVNVAKAANLDFVVSPGLFAFGEVTSCVAKASTYYENQTLTFTNFDSADKTFSVTCNSNAFPSGVSFSLDFCSSLCSGSCSVTVPAGTSLSVELKITINASVPGQNLHTGYFGTRQPYPYGYEGKIFVDDGATKVEIPFLLAVRKLQLGAAASVCGAFVPYYEPPTIDPPVACVTEAGREVIIWGGGFDSSTKVTFGGVSAGVLGFDERRLYVLAPPQPAGTVVDVTVTDACENSIALPAAFTYAASSPFTYTVSPTRDCIKEENKTIAISAFYEQIITECNNKIVNFPARDFSEGTQVYFGGVKAGVLDFDEKEIFVSVAPQPPGTVDVTIVNTSCAAATTIPNAFTFVNPSISSITPRFIQRGTKTPVNVSGSDFAAIGFTGGVYAVKQGSTDCRDTDGRLLDTCKVGVTVLSDTELTFSAQSFPVGDYDLVVVTSCESENTILDDFFVVPNAYAVVSRTADVSASSCNNLFLGQGISIFEVRSPSDVQHVEDIPMASPHVIAKTSDDRWMFISQWGNGSVAVVDAARRELRHVVNVLGRGQPLGLALTPDDSELVVTFTDTGTDDTGNVVRYDVVGLVSSVDDDDDGIIEGSAHEIADYQVAGSPGAVSVYKKQSGALHALVTSCARPASVACSVNDRVYDIRFSDGLVQDIMRRDEDPLTLFYRPNHVGILNESGVGKTAIVTNRNIANDTGTPGFVVSLNLEAYPPEIQAYFETFNPGTTQNPNPSNPKRGQRSGVFDSKGRVYFALSSPVSGGLGHIQRLDDAKILSPHEFGSYWPSNTSSAIPQSMRASVPFPEYPELLFIADGGVFVKGLAVVPGIENLTTGTGGNITTAPVTACQINIPVFDVEVIIPKLALTTVSPAEICDSGLMEFTISGANFREGITVRFVLGGAERIPDELIVTPSLLFASFDIALSPGVYTVTAQNPGEDLVSLTGALIVAGDPPVAAFTHDAPKCAGLAVRFTDGSANLPTAWAWDFGDGNTSVLQNPAHTYAAEGNYTVTLTAKNACGDNTHQSSVVVIGAPSASFTYVATCDKGVAFTDTSTNAPTSWFWNFGDGTASTEQNPVHSYAVTGNYTVSLTAFNVCGSSGTYQVTDTFYVLTVTNILPFISSVNGGAKVTITGTGFIPGATSVSFQKQGFAEISTKAPPTVTATEIQLVTPNVNASGTCLYDVIIRTGNCTVVLPEAFQFLERKFVDESATRSPINREFGIGNVRLADIDGDGDLDIIISIVSSSLNPHPTRILINDGAGFFTDETEARLPALEDTGIVSFDVVLSDVNNDGYLDIFQANTYDAVNINTLVAVQNRLYLNDGSGVFTDVTASHLPSMTDYSNTVVFFDIDGDGDLDAFVGNGEIFSRPATNIHQDQILINDGTGKFTFGTEGRIPPEDGWARKAAVVDFNLDGFLDIYVLNHGEDFLLINDGTGVFTNELSTRIPGIDTTGESTRILEVIDVNKDSKPDLLIRNRVFVNTAVGGEFGYFVEETASRVAESEQISMLRAPVDYDGDGDFDLTARFFGTAGTISNTGPETVFWLFENDGAGFFNKCHWVDNINATGRNTVGDLDGDGWPDIVLVRSGGSGVRNIHILINRPPNF